MDKIEAEILRMIREKPGIAGYQIGEHLIGNGIVTNVITVARALHIMYQAGKINRSEVEIQGGSGTRFVYYPVEAE